MAYNFDESGGTLEDILSRQADSSAMTIGNQFARKRRQAIGQQAAQGRIRSGVSNYQFGDIASDEIGALGDVESGLAGALGQIPINDYATNQDNLRRRQLAELLAELNRQSPLEEALGGLGLAGNLAGTFAGFL